ncbi:hypothetical protein [Mycolicibacterium flavescens]|nr:hypothetical protein [Mycolicibacterium flavescens]
MLSAANYAEICGVSALVAKVWMNPPLWISGHACGPRRQWLSVWPPTIVPFLTEGTDMGNRANLVILEDGQWSLYYSHWVGCRTLDALVCGPVPALRFLRSFRECGPMEWTSPIWADGGVVLDLDRRRMLFFGEELMCEMFIRRAILDVLALTWPDFAVGWAYGGTEELAAYVGAQRPWKRGRTPPELKLAQKPRSLCHLVSVAGADGEVRFWPLWWGSSAAWHGPELVDRLPGQGIRRLKLGMIPESGVHVDVPTRRIGAWVTSEVGLLFEMLPELWPGWQVQRWDDRYEEQLTRCHGSLSLPELDLAGGIDVAQRWIGDRYRGERDLGMVWSQRPDPGEWATFETACASLRSTYTRSA